MRSIIGVTLYGAFHICYFLGLEPIASLPPEHILVLSSLLALYVLMEVSFLTARIRALKPKARQAPLIEAQKQSEIKAVPQPSIVEQERDELRDRLAQAVLERERLLAEKADAAKKAEALTMRVRDLEEGAEEQGRRYLLHFLSRLQERGRLIDFLMDDVTPYADAQIGAASRVVHEGCRQALRETLEIEPVYSGKEGDPYSLDGAPREEWRVMGSGSAQGAPKGRVLHRGWKVTRIRLPKLSGSQSVIAPAELALE